MWLPCDRSTIDRALEIQIYFPYKRKKRKECRSFIKKKDSSDFRAAVQIIPYLRLGAAFTDCSSAARVEAYKYMLLSGLESCEAFLAFFSMLTSEIVKGGGFSSSDLVVGRRPVSPFVFSMWIVHTWWNGSERVPAFILGVRFHTKVSVRARPEQRLLLVLGWKAGREEQDVLQLRLPLYLA